MYDPTANKPVKLVALGRLACRRAREGHASVPRQLAEMAWLRIFNGMTPPDYFCTGLYRTGLSWREKAEHLGSGRYMRGLRRVNDKRYDYLALNKLVAYGLMRTFGIPTPKVHAVVGHKGGRSCDGTRINGPEQLAEIVNAMGEADLCFKPVHGWAGRGFIGTRVRGRGHGTTLTTVPDGVTYTVADFWKQALEPQRMYMVQPLVHGHHDLAAFNPSSLNTVRIWMVRNDAGSWDPFAAVLRMGVGDVVVDNDPRYAMYAPVDIADGRLGAAVDESVDRIEYRAHPVSGVLIEGAMVPKWDEVLALSRRASGLLPFVRLLGLDVAVTTEGVMVMELETAPGDDQVGFDRGIKTLFARLSEQPQELFRNSKASATVSTAETMV